MYGLARVMIFGNLCSDSTKIYTSDVISHWRIVPLLTKNCYSSKPSYIILYIFFSSFGKDSQQLIDRPIGIINLKYYSTYVNTTQIVHGALYEI